MKLKFIDIIAYPFRIILIPLSTVLFSIYAIFLFILKAKDKHYYRLIRQWAISIVFISGTKIKITGKEYLSADESYIFVSNHTSLYDIPIMITALNYNLRIIYKKELQKVPIFGWGLSKTPYIAIEREDPRKAMESLNNALQAIQTGDSVIVYPEGTRSRSGKINAFKRGAFLLAARAGKPIVPITIIGSWEIIPNGKKIIRSKEIQFIIHKPVESQDYTKQSEKQLMDAIHKIIASPLIETQNILTK